MGFRALLEKGKKCAPGGPPPARIYSSQVDTKRRAIDDPSEESPGSEFVQPSPQPSVVVARPKLKRNGRAARSKKPAGGIRDEIRVAGLKGTEFEVEVPVGMGLEVREDPADAEDELEDDEEEKVDIMRE